MNIYVSLAETVLAVHLLFILWVVGGVLVVRRYASLRWIHIGSLAYSIYIEVVPWPPCPLTILEQSLEHRAGVASYHGPFLLHYLDALVYPNLPLTLLVSLAVFFCVANLVFYACRSRIDRLTQRAPKPQKSCGQQAESHLRTE